MKDFFKGQVIKSIEISGIDCKPYIAKITGPSEKYRYQRYIGINKTGGDRSVNSDSERSLRRGSD